MSELHQDITIGVIFVTGLLGFLSGEFILSSTLFAASAIASNVNVNRKRGQAGQLACE